VMQDDAAAAAVELEPQSAAFVPLEALRACGSRPVRAVPVYRRVCGKVVCGRLGGRQLSYFIQCAIGSLVPAGW
jgi:hypothetical protein